MWTLGSLGFLLSNVTADTVYLMVFLETILGHPHGRTEAKAEAPILWPPDLKSWLIGKDPDAGKDWRWEEKRMTEDEMVGWHYELYGHEFEQVPGVGNRQGSLVSMGLQRVEHNWVAELTELKKLGTQKACYKMWRSSNPTFGCIPKENESWIWNSYQHSRIHCSIIHKS